MSLKLAARLVTLPPYKILDLQENDTIAHIEDLSSIFPKETKAILIEPKCMSGTGNFNVYTLSGSMYTKMSISAINIAPILNRELKWANSVANDDWDIYLYGYFVQKRTR